MFYGKEEFKTLFFWKLLELAGKQIISMKHEWLHKNTYDIGPEIVIKVTCKTTVILLCILYEFIIIFDNILR